MGTLIRAARAIVMLFAALALGLVLWIYVSEWIAVPVTVVLLVWGVPTAWNPDD